MGYDRDKAISSLLHGQAIQATQPVPPALYGHDPKYVAPYGYDPRAARALLDKFGYKDRDGDGYRELPDGKPLTLRAGLDAGQRRARERRAVEEATWTRSASGSRSSRTSGPS